MKVDELFGSEECKDDTEWFIYKDTCKPPLKVDQTEITLACNVFAFHAID